MPAYKIDPAKTPDFSKMSYEQEVSFWENQDNWLEFSEDLDTVKDVTVNFRISPLLKRKLQLIARRSDRSLSSLLRMWTLEKLGKIM